jgi:hypothetical protein
VRDHDIAVWRRSFLATLDALASEQV